MADSIQITSSAATKGHKDVVICRVCKRQFAKYTCPTCNIPYCSLTCFRSPVHNQCSETFYKKEIETDIHSGPSKTAQEQQQMMELLRNFEEEDTSERFFGEEEEEDAGQSDLARRFDSVDLDSLSPDELWSMLTPEERKEFTKAFDDPTSELAQRLLSSEQLGKEIRGPWWEAPAIEGECESSEGLSPQYGPRPRMMDVPASMVKPLPTGHPLVYNMCAICIAYVYTTRHMGVSPLGTLQPGDLEHRAARRLISQLVPFLTERKSTQIYSDLPSVITVIWSLSEPGNMASELISLLLRDAARLLRPLRVTQVVSSEESDKVSSAHPHIMPVLVLSDLYDLFSDNVVPSKPNHITHKLRFYAAHVLSTPSTILRLVANEMSMRAQNENEGIGRDGMEKKKERRTLVEERSITDRTMKSPLP
ncbi:hypothetical protein CPB84DRAFT_1765790 [Gymnopilus junonius]|uniref:HIT-type domain-containing protein n=1 Tax=Gymnopilus junonius TaxID=109634 RepID=A0A9P5TRE8_GYMJU|nr:hypothetical protein CPB84DRAFT_1765790 [Gymnopilus junonius]